MDFMKERTTGNDAYPSRDYKYCMDGSRKVSGRVAASGTLAERNACHCEESAMRQSRPRLLRSARNDVRVLADRTRSERFFASLRMTEQEGGQAAFLRRKPACPLTVFEARGEEAQRAFGALRHPPLLPAKPDEGF